MWRKNTTEDDQENILNAVNVKVWMAFMNFNSKIISRDLEKANDNL